MGKLSRIGWGSMAVLFLVTSATLTILVILQAVRPNPTPPQPACAFNPSVPAAKLPPPPPYKPETKTAQLITSDLAKGAGPAAKAGDCVSVKYYGTLASGKVFDQNYTANTALQFQLGVGYVIQGWEQGLLGMKAGGTRRLLIPPKLGYGPQAQGPIPANSDLIFTVKLLDIK